MLSPSARPFQYPNKISRHLNGTLQPKKTNLFLILIPRKTNKGENFRVYNILTSDIILLKIKYSRLLRKLKIIMFL